MNTHTMLPQSHESDPEKPVTDLNGHHKQQSKCLVEEVCAQPLMSSEAFMKQILRLASQARQTKKN